MAEAVKDAPKVKTKSKAKPRIHTLDELRGFAVFCMVFYHAFYSIGVFFNAKWGMDLLNFFSPAEPYFAGLFIIIAGISSQLSHSNLERGCKLLFIALAVTVVTFFVVGSNGTIRFGILHMLAICMMAYGLIGKYLNLIPMWIGVVVSMFLFSMTYSITSGAIGIPFIFSHKLPVEWYQTNILFMFGFHDSTFTSSDYFPIIPWIFLFFAGTFLGKPAAANKFPKFMYKKRIPFFSFIGKHALVIYILHQPVIWGICYAAKWIVGLFSAG